MATASEVMTKTPVTIRLTARVRDAVRLLDSLEVRHLPVVDSQGEFIGMLDDRALEEARAPFSRTALDSPVSGLLSGRGFAAVDPSTDAAAIVDVMLARHLGAVPVIDRGGALIGLVSYMDVLRAWPFHSQATEPSEEEP